MNYIINIILFVAGLCLGIIGFAYYGYPGTLDPPALQSQTVIPVKIGELNEENKGLKDATAYLAPFIGIKGNRNYSALIVIPAQGKSITVAGKLVLYLRANNSDIIQPIIITQKDFQPRGSNIAVKLLDQGPNSGQYYENSTEITLSSNH